MARDYDKQRLFTENGYTIDCGTVSFTTTGAEVEITTPLSKIYFVEFAPVYAADNTDPTAGTNEHLWLDEAIRSVDGITAVSSHAVSLRRAAEPFYLSGVASTDYITANQYVEVPIGVAPVAGTLNQAWYYNDIKAAGSPLINIGHVPSSGTGTADPDEFLADAKTEAAPASSVGKTVTSFTATAVGALDLITFSSSGASGDPQGGWCQVKITPTLTSGLTVQYMFIGID